MEVDGVENINVTFRTFADNINFDAENVSDATITVSSPLSGFSSIVGVLNAHDNAIVAGTGVTQLTVEGYDEGVITAGDGVTLIVSSESDTWNLNISGDVTVAAEAEGSAGESATVDITGASGSTMNWNYDGDLIQELTLSGDMTFVVDADNLDGEVAISGADATLEITDGTLNLLDVDVAAIQVGGEGESVVVTNAEDKTISIVAAEAEVNIDTGEDGGSFTVVLAADGTTLNAGDGTDNATSATIVVGADVETIAGITTDVALEIQTEAGGDVSFTDAAGVASSLTSGEAAVTINGAGAVTMILAGAALDAAESTGAIDVTLDYSGSNIELGSGADTITLGADAEGDVTVMSNDGNDTFNLELFNDGEGSYYVDGGAGNDLFVLATVEGSTDTNPDNIVIAGGVGTDTARVTLDDAGETGWNTAINYSALDTFTLNGIEVFNIVGSSVSAESETAAEFAAEADVTFGARSLDGLTLSITGNAAGNQVVAINMDDGAAGEGGSSLDLSKVTIAATIETVVIDFTDGASADDAIVATTTTRADLVIGPNDVAGFSINLAGGNDEFTISSVGGELTLGSGSDVIIFQGDGDAFDGEDATGIVAVSDFNNASDSIFDLDGIGISGDILAAEDNDVSGADADGEATDIIAAVADGIVTLVGTDADVIDTVEEWIDVVTAIGDAGIFAFEFDGSTYVVNSDGTDAFDAVQLVGVTGLTLSTGVDDGVITIAS